MGVGRAPNVRYDRASLPAGYLASVADLMQLQSDVDPLQMDEISLCSVFNRTCTEAAY